jgi:DNA-binding NarL/FixJ family response regulator
LPPLPVAENPVGQYVEPPIVLKVTLMPRRARHRAGANKLTPRESEVVRLATEGKSNGEIAELLSIGERTVETHIAAIFDRFDLTSRRQLAGLVDA